MIIDLILDRKDGREYNHYDFYIACMGYGRIADDITRAMDCGTEEDVKKALCAYIEKNEYNPLICDYIQKLNWLNKSHWIIEEAAAKAFQAACFEPYEGAKAMFNVAFDDALAFVSDKEKMIDFAYLSKDEFLESYSYLTEEEYDATARVAVNLKCLPEKVNTYSFECGVLVLPEHEEFAYYSNVNPSLPYGFYDENQGVVLKAGLASLKDEMRKYVEKGVEKTYAVIALQHPVEIGSKEYQDIVNGDAAAEGLSYEHFRNPADILWSLCKTDGQLIEGFLEAALRVQPSVDKVLDSATARSEEFSGEGNNKDCLLKE